MIHTVETIDFLNFIPEFRNYLFIRNDFEHFLYYVLNSISLSGRHCISFMAQTILSQLGIRIQWLGPLFYSRITI